MVVGFGFLGIWALLCLSVSFCCFRVVARVHEDGRWATQGVWFFELGIP